MGERLKAFRSRIRQKLCRHEGQPRYEEARAQDGPKVSWSAMYVCPECGAVLGVEASFYGNPFRVGEAVEEQVTLWDASASLGKEEDEHAGN